MKFVCCHIIMQGHRCLFEWDAFCSLFLYFLVTLWCDGKAQEARTLRNLCYLNICGTFTDLSTGCISDKFEQRSLSIVKFWSPDFLPSIWNSRYNSYDSIGSAMLLPWLDRRTLICCESEFKVEWLMEGSLSTSTEEWWGLDKWNNSSSKYSNDPGDLLLCTTSSSVHLLQKSIWDPTGKAFSSLSCESSFGLLLSCELACFFTTFLCLACDQARTTKWSLCMVKLLFSLIFCFYFWPLLTVYQKRLLGSSFRQHSRWRYFGP